MPSVLGGFPRKKECITGRCSKKKQEKQNEKIIGSGLTGLRIRNNRNGGRDNGSALPDSTDWSQRGLYAVGYGSGQQGIEQGNERN
jgi:hypothetical protein